MSYSDYKEDPDDVDWRPLYHAKGPDPLAVDTDEEQALTKGGQDLEDVEAETNKMMKKEHKRLDHLQELLYAEGKHSVLVIFQAMDCGGKDSTIKGVFGPLNPQGVQVTSFKAPSSTEKAHDYLWRCHAALPPKGTIGVHNRSHYEDVTCVKVHKWASEEDIEKRYRQINDFERMLSENGVLVLKFFLHISKAHQKERLQKRLEDPAKHWKFSTDDLRDRKLWPQYQAAYKRAIFKTNTEWAPWYIIPSDLRWRRVLPVAKIVRKAIEGLHSKYPEPEKGLDLVVISDDDEEGDN